MTGHALSVDDTSRKLQKQAMPPFEKKTIKLAKSIRKLCLEMVFNAKASHIASALSICDILAVLYGRVLLHRPSEPSWVGRDRFILSKGHACVAVYAILAETGFFSRDLLKTYGKDNSVLMNHISHKVPGVEFSTGSLGHGLPFGTGKALAAKRLGHKWRTFVLMSDGELDEGSNWESFLFVAHHGLDNLVAVIDFNNLQSLTTISETLTLEPLADKLQAFGWDVRELDGHNHQHLHEQLSELPNGVGKPTVIIARTIKGKGVSFMENRVEWHYKSPTHEQLEAALAEIDSA
jgi:transketolase